MGNPSISIMLHEILKLLHYARTTKDVKFIRIGTCGGVGVPGGTTVISDRVYNGLHESYYDQSILGRPVRRAAILDRKLSQDLMHHATRAGLQYPVVTGNTLCADDFYEEQARIDGAFCEFTNGERMAYLEKCYHAYGIRNFEMESLAFAALTHHAGIKGNAPFDWFFDWLIDTLIVPSMGCLLDCLYVRLIDCIIDRMIDWFNEWITAAVVCVVIVNRLESDKIAVEVEQHLEDWTCRPQRIVAELIKHELLETANLDLQNLRLDLATTTDHLFNGLVKSDLGQDSLWSSTSDSVTSTPPTEKRTMADIDREPSTPTVWWVFFVL